MGLKQITIHTKFMGELEGDNADPAQLAEAENIMREAMIGKLADMGEKVDAYDLNVTCYQSYEDDSEIEEGSAQEAMGARYFPEPIFEHNLPVILIACTATQQVEVVTP